MALSIGITVFTLFGLLGTTATAQAAPNIILVTFTDTSQIQYTDLSGNAIGEGAHVGELLCIGDTCNQKIEFEPVSLQPTTDTVVIEYKFKAKQVFDPIAKIVVVAGSGTVLSDGSKTRFSFTGTFQNNGDGTVRVTYIASTPDASFIFPAAPGTFRILNNN